MKVIGVIGSIGAGKSTTCKRLVNCIHHYNEDANVVSLDLDEVVKDIHKTNPAFGEELYHTFGHQMKWTGTERAHYVLNEIFPRRGLYNTLAKIIAFYVGNWLQQCIPTYRRQGIDVLIIEGVHFIHSKRLASYLDCVIQVSANKYVCLDRVGARNRYSSDQARILYERTTPPADFSIPNGSKYVISTDSVGFETMAELDDILKRELPTLLKDSPISDIRVTEGVAKYTPNTSTEKVAIYAGSFNPLHKGHIAVVVDLLRTFDRVILLACVNGGKDSSKLSPIDSTKLPNGCELERWGRAFVDFLDLPRIQQLDVTIARGIRNGADLDYEMAYIKHLRDQYSLRSRELPPVLLVPCRDEYRHISSSSIRAIQPFDAEYANTLLP